MCWIERAVATLSHFEGAEENLADIIHEVRDEYEKSMRVVVLSYLLKSPVERRRLGISKVAPEWMAKEIGWGAEKSIWQPPQAWRSRVQEARVALEKRLIGMNPDTTQLSFIFGYNTPKISPW